MHGHHHLLQRGLSAGLGGTVNTVLKGAVGAGLAVLGTYLVSRSGERMAMETRMERLEAMLQDLEKKSRSPAPE